MTIEKKFIFIPLLVAILSILIISFSMQYISSTVENHYTNNHPKLEVIYEIEININEAATEVYLEKVDSDVREQAFIRFQDAIEDLNFYLAKYEALIDDTEKKDFENLSSNFIALSGTGNEIFELYSQQFQKIVQRRELLNNNLEVYLDEGIQFNIKDIENVTFDLKHHAANEIEINMHELISAVRGYILKSDQFLKERVIDSQDDLTYWINIYKSQKLTNDERTIIQKLDKDTSMIIVLSDEIIDLEDAIKIDVKHFEILQKRLDELLDDSIQPLLHQKLTAEAKFVHDTLIIFTILSTIIIAILMYALYKSIQPVVQTINMLRKSTKEFLETNIINISFKKKDELGILASDLKHMMHEIKNESEEKESILNDLFEANKQMKKATEAKSNFLANMSHEIRTPMNGMLGFLGQLAKTEKDRERLKKFDVIKTSGEQLLSIINDILDFSKIESGKMEVESHPCSFKNLYNSTTEIFGQLARNKGINLESNIDEQVPKCIMGDKTKLQQILFNLLSNAIKFTSSGGQVKLNSQFNKDKNSITISIEDSGIGISKEKLKHIFEAFEQENDSTTRKYGGTGLGLSISSRLVELMQSELKVESEFGKGSTFYFELPVKICSEKQLETNEEVNSISSIHFEAHALIVEDNKTNQMLLSMLLDDLGFTYDIAVDGVEAINKFNHNEYAIIFMDENMPNMNGIESTQHIRKIEVSKSLNPSTIVAVTANALTGDKERFLNAGMDDYISKPYTEEDIVKVLQKYLG